MSTTEAWRVSVATYNRVLFPHPKDGTLMLTLERKATVRSDSGGNVEVRAQPFGGVVHILNLTSLQQTLGEIQFDSERSRHEQDFRILIPPTKWQTVKQYCLQHLQNADDSELESLPDRELAEEFEEAVGIHLKSDQYTVRSSGFVVENNPVPTENVYARGLPTLRIYRIFEVQILDQALCQTMLNASRQYPAHELAVQALRNSRYHGRGWANSVLTLPLSAVTEAYLSIPSEMRYRKIVMENHELDESLLAILEDVDVPQYQRL